MSSRSRLPATASASSSLATHQATLSSTRPRSRSRSSNVWVDPASLPDCGVDLSTIAGNVPDYVKRLNSNTYYSYGVGSEDCFGYEAGKAVKFVEVSIDRRLEREDRLVARTVAEVPVTKRECQVELMPGSD